MISSTNANTRHPPLQKKLSSRPPPIARYELFLSENEILINNKADSDNLLVINRKTLTSCFVPLSELNSYKLEKPLSIYGIFGKVEINGITFIIAISKAKTVATLGDSQILKIESIKFLTVNREHYKNFAYESCWDRLERIKSYIRLGFYFSYTYRLQSDFENAFEYPAKVLMKDARSNPFVWNYKAIRSLSSNRELKFERQNTSDKHLDDIRLSYGEFNENDLATEEANSNFDHFFFPIIQGYIGSIDTPEFKIVLISRRSTHMSGTRYNSRGCDNMGNAANYVQTEQLLVLKNKVYSFSQIRGSLPFYWEQPKGLINPMTIIHQRPEINLDLFQKHLKSVLGTKYQKLIFFNLLSNKRPEEETLTKYLGTLIENTIPTPDYKDKLHYCYVDFHSITKQADFSSIDSYIYDLFNLGSAKCNLYEYEIGVNTYVPRYRQNVLMRTNCLDCLDRTNAVQTKFGFYALFKSLVSSDSELLKCFQGRFMDEPLSVFEKSNIAFFETFRKLWADNGDTISKIYAGTGATTSSVTRKGDQSTLSSFIDHKLKTLSRFYINNFDDDFKQEIIDMLLHKRSSSIRQNSTLLRELEPELFDSIKVSFITIFSCSKNENVSISERTLEGIFKNNKGTDVIIFITRLDRPRSIHYIADQRHIYDSFNDLFKTLSKQLHGFKLVEQSEACKFEIYMFALEKNPSLISYFKSEKIAVSALSPHIGVRSSFILNNNGIELFSLKLEQTTFGYSPAKSLEKVFERYIDKDYDLIIITGYIEDVELELESVSKNYDLALQEIRKGEKDGKYSSHLILYCSKNVIQMENQPSYAPLQIDKYYLSDELTINAHSFLINQPK